MEFIIKLAKLFAEYFVFFVGLLFIFVIGLLYAFIDPQDTAVRVIFFLIAAGWVVFLIKYFWDLMSRNEKNS